MANRETIHPGRRACARAGGTLEERGSGGFAMRAPDFAPLRRSWVLLLPQPRRRMILGRGRRSVDRPRWATRGR
eukprot:130779-Pyramimonas_sp.AAC.1